MFAAARIGDPLTHDTMVTCGVIGPPLGQPPPMVMIEGMPAAHVGCTVICSAATSAGPAHPPIPPMGPPQLIVKGSTTVFINNMPAARWVFSGDIGTCGVFLGDPKRLQARRTFIGG
jgi:uncharacterized Zn-binding protein involved in type VI secretion